MKNEEEFVEETPEVKEKKVVMRNRVLREYDREICKNAKTGEMCPILEECEALWKSGGLIEFYGKKENCVQHKSEEAFKEYKEQIAKEEEQDISFNDISFAEEEENDS